MWGGDPLCRAASGSTTSGVGPGPRRAPKPFLDVGFLGSRASPELGSLAPRPRKQGRGQKAPSRAKRAQDRSSAPGAKSPGPRRWGSGEGGAFPPRRRRRRRRLRLAGWAGLFARDLLASAPAAAGGVSLAEGAVGGAGEGAGWDWAAVNGGQRGISAFCLVPLAASSSPASPPVPPKPAMGACCHPCRAALGLGGLACLACGIAMILVVPGVVKDQVTKNVRLDPEGMAFNLWKDIPVPFYMSIYFFEVLNPNEVLRGAKPVVNQRGPYVYREYREKVNITFNDNDTLSFLEYRRFHFQPDLSNGSESDYIVVPNILVLGAAMMLQDLPFAVKLTISSTFALFKQSAFMNRTVGEVMWGYDDPLIEFLNSIKPGLIPFKGKFGLFADFNNSNTGLFTVYTGMNDTSRVHMVDRWNGLKKVSYWNSDQCNMINGTAGELWPPFRTPSTPLEFYSPDACRSMSLTFSHSGEFKGVPIYRYLASKTLFANGTDYPPNEGFCPCLQSGIQNVSSCRLNAPVFISHPHFLNADPSLLEAVDGLHPNEEEHGLFLDLHPMTGIPMKCAIKLQLNIFTKKVPGILQTGRIEPVVLPLLWFAESGEIEGDVLKEFYFTLVLLPSVLGYLQYCLVALGGVLLIAAALFGLRSKVLDLFSLVQNFDRCSLPCKCGVLRDLIV